MSEPTPAREPRPRSSSGHDLTPPSAAELARMTAGLSHLERHVACDAGTERAFSGRYWNHHEDGIYLCIVCGLPLFRSDSKFESGTGWPSFLEPYDPDHVAERRDTSLGMFRMEVRCGRCDAHLGHVFPDGPEPRGMRYCMNSAALVFHPAAEPLPERSRPAK